MSQTIEISRELAERLALPPKDNRGWTTWNSAVAYEAAKELRELLAAPVVERQDIQDWAIDHSAGRPILTLKGCSVIEAEDAAYVLSLVRRDQSPPAPEAADEDRALLDRHEAWMAGVENGKASSAVEIFEAFAKGFNTFEQANMQFANRDDAWAAYNAMNNIDKVKELNQ